MANTFKRTAKTVDAVCFRRENAAMELAQILFTLGLILAIINLPIIIRLIPG